MAEPATTTPVAAPAATPPPAEVPKPAATVAPTAPAAKPPETRRLAMGEKIDVLLADAKAKAPSAAPNARPDAAKLDVARPEAKATPPPEVKADVPRETPAPTVAPSKTDEKAAPEPSAPQDATSETEPVAEFAGATAPLYESLKAIPDPKVRAQVRAAIAQANAYKQVGMPLGEAKERKQLAPTIEVAREVHQTAARALELRGALASGTPDGVRTFIGALHQESPQAVEALVREVGEHIYELDRPAFLKIGEQAMRNGLATVRARAKEAGGETCPACQRGNDLDMAAQIVEEEIFGRSQPQQQQPQRDPNDVARLHALEQREREFDTRQRQGFIQGINGEFQRVVEREADDLIKQADPEGIYPEAGVKRLRKAIIDRVSREVITQPVIRARTQQMLNAGRYDQEQSGRVVSHLVNQARALLPSIAAEVLNEYGQEFSAVQSRRQQKLSEAASTREISSGLPAPVTQPRKEIDTRGMTTKEKLEALMAARR
jgi:hypothetical protein